MIDSGRRQLTKDDQLKISEDLRKRFGKKKIPTFEAKKALSDAEAEFWAEKDRKASQRTLSKDRKEEKREKKRKNERKARKLNRRK